MPVSPVDIQDTALQDTAWETPGTGPVLTKPARSRLPPPPLSVAVTTTGASDSVDRVTASRDRRLASVKVCVHSASRSAARDSAPWGGGVLLCDGDELWLEEDVELSPESPARSVDAEKRSPSVPLPRAPARRGPGGASRRTDQVTNHVASMILNAPQRRPSVSMKSRECPGRLPGTPWEEPPRLLGGFAIFF